MGGLLIAAHRIIKDGKTTIGQIRQRREMGTDKTFWQGYVQGTGFWHGDFSTDTEAEEYVRLGMPNRLVI